MATAKSNYKSFNRSLTLDSEDWDYETKQELRNLMKEAGYHEKAVKIAGEKHLIYDFPTELQLDYAWRYLKGKDITTYLADIIADTVKRRGKEFKVYRARRELEIKGRKYRSGQFVPKKR